MLVSLTAQNSGRQISRLSLAAAGCPLCWALNSRRSWDLWRALRPAGGAIAPSERWEPPNSAPGRREAWGLRCGSPGAPTARRSLSPPGSSVFATVGPSGARPERARGGAKSGSFLPSMGQALPGTPRDEGRGYHGASVSPGDGACEGQAVAECIQEQCQALLVPPLDLAGPQPPVLSPAAHLSTIPRVGLGLVLAPGCV